MDTYWFRTDLPDYKRFTSSNKLIFFFLLPTLFSRTHNDAHVWFLAFPFYPLPTGFFPTSLAATPWGRILPCWVVGFSYLKIIKMRTHFYHSNLRNWKISTVIIIIIFVNPSASAIQRGWLHEDWVRAIIKIIFLIIILKIRIFFFSEYNLKLVFKLKVYLIIFW